MQTNFRIVAYHDGFGSTEPAIVNREYPDGTLDLTEFPVNSSNAITRHGVQHGFGLKSWSEVGEEPKKDVATDPAVAKAQSAVDAASAKLAVAIADFKEAPTETAGQTVDSARKELADANKAADSARVSAQKAASKPVDTPAR